jgi:phenylpropionate dioxygenase-like ring-hydroxylating dioxygenase large terminal subunit
VGKSKNVTLADIPHVSHGTAAGEWFRRYWVVVGTMRELQDIPKAVKVLGEDLVLFRDAVGQIGLLGLQCPHRGASLEYGDIENGGLRCPYHGWLFDVRGRCLEMPTEPKESRFPQKVSHVAYPVRERGGLIFAYLGPDREQPPPLPKYKALADPAGQRSLEATRVYGSISSRTAPIRFTFRFYTAPIQATALGGVGFSTITTFHLSMQWRLRTA